MPSLLPALLTLVVYKLIASKKNVCYPDYYLELLYYLLFYSYFGDFESVGL